MRVRPAPEVRRARPRAGAAGAFALCLAAALPAFAQEGACDGALERGADLAPVLAAVPRFGGTYVLVYRDAGDAGLADLATADPNAAIAAHARSPGAAVAESIFGRAPVVRGYDAAQPAALVTAVLAGEVDGAVIWAPLAGLGAGQLDFGYDLSLRTVGTPQTAPTYAAGAAAADTDPCADEIRGVLEGYGVIAAEQLVPVDIRDLLALGTPARDLGVAEASLGLYELHCARCHGPEGVAAPGALAPVDLVRSVRRFSWPGFLYVVLNGRQQNGMPGFRGALDRAEVAGIYQYVRERAHGTLEASAAALEAAADALPPPTTSVPGTTPDAGR